MSEEWRGKPDITKQRDLWKILNLVNAKSDDVFCDLGCGHGNLCKWAIQRIKKSIGTEDHKKRYRHAIKNTRKYPNIKILNEEYRYEKTIHKVRKATIFYCTNDESFGFYRNLEKVLTHKAYFVTYGPPPYPIKPERYDGLYYAMKIPFEIAKTRAEWKKTIAKDGSIVEFKKRFMQDFEDSEEYMTRLIDMSNDMSGFDWISCKRKK